MLAAGRGHERASLNHKQHIRYLDLLKKMHQEVLLWESIGPI